MSRYIDADLIQYKAMCRPRGNGMYEDCETAHKDQIDDIPTADVRENVRGKWIDGKVKHIKNGELRNVRECSECGSSYFVYDNYNSVDEIPNFCPNCGADMRGEA